MLGITGRPRGTEWYNSYPFGIETDVIYSRFLGICRGKKFLTQYSRTTKNIINILNRIS